MKKLQFLMIVIVFALTGAITAGASPLQQESVDVIPPGVVETMPFEGEELLLDGTITIYFDQAMDQASVEAAFSVESDTDAPAELTWLDEMSLVIAPQEAWARDAALTFRIDATATSADGVALPDPYEITFHTVGFLEVTEVLPGDGQTEVDTDSLITVIFNRPVVPLVSIEEQQDLPDPLEITPDVNGTGEWLNTSIYVFHPDPGLHGGVDHTVTVKAGLTDVTGAVLQNDYTWTFSTLQPEIIDVSPGFDSGSVPLKMSARVEFSQAMNPETTSQAFSIQDANGVKVAGGFVWEDDNRSFTFTPNDLLTLDSIYSIVVDIDVATSESGAHLEEGWSSSFSTVPYPAIVNSRPVNGESNASPYGGFDVYFNAPIDIDTLEDKFTIEPEPWREYDTYYYDYNNRYTLFFDTEPSTQYTITIAPGIADPYGNTINETTVITYMTGPYDPEINLNVPALVGLYSAYNPNTRVFATHRNVSRLNLELYDLPLETLGGFLGDNSYQFMRDFIPPRDGLLRRWSVAVQSQPNMRRYELLLLSREGGDGIENIQCLGAPPPQMQVGDFGKVSEDDPRPLRVRSLPNLQGDIITEIEPGTGFDVIGGPICADGYIWWNIDIRGSDVTGWSAEGSSDGYFIEMVERYGDVIKTDEMNPDDYPALQPGVYYLTMSAPETSARGYDPLEHVALVATANITFKYSPNQAMAWVTDLQTGEPIPDVQVRFYDASFGILGRINTDENGLAILEIPRLSSLYTSLFAGVDDGDVFGFGAGYFDNGMSPWQFGVNGDFEPSTFEAYLYSDRPLYRPGQPVYFRGVLRNRDDVTFTIPQNLNTVPITVFDPQDQIVYEGDLPLTDFGTFSGQFTLDNEAALGFYRIVVNLDETQRSYYSLGFNVGEYVAPEFQVEVTPAQDEVVQGDTVQVMVESRYFFGGAVSDAQVEWTALSANYAFTYTGTGRYDFTDFNYDEGPGEFYGGFGERIADGTGTTDSQGRFMIELPADLGTKTQSQEYTIEARVVDESDQLVAGRATVVVHQGDVYVGLSPEEYIGKTGEDTAVNLVVVNWDSEPVAGQDVDYEVVERVWSSVQEKDELGRTIWTWDVEENPVEDGSGTVTTDADGKAVLSFVPANAGTYKIYGRTRDDKGNRIQSSTFMWVSGSEFVSWRQQNSNRFDLITNADNYRVGDTAEILIASPFQGETTALITIERGDILEHQVLKLETNSEIYRLPITDDFAPNIFVSVIIVKGVDEDNPYAQFRMGLTQLSVDTERLALNVEVTPDVAEGEFVGPGDDVTYKVKTTDWQGNPVSAEVGIGVTDLAVLSIASPNSGTLMDYFYHETGVAVRTSSALTVSVDQATQTIIDTVKGGGGGGDDAGIFDIRQEFVDTPGWKPDLVTDENGEGEYTLTLPDNLTTWRLDARAITRGSEGEPMLVGQTTTDVLSTKPLLVRPLTPRFLVVDDVIDFGAIVNNNTGETQTVEISMQGTGFLLEDENAELTQTVEIPAGARQRVNWTLRALDVPYIDVTFFASGNDGQYTDATKPTAGTGDDRILPVYKYEVPETVGTAGLLTEGGSRTELVALPHRFDVTQGELTIKVDRSLAGATVDGLEYLKNFPHQCIEQTVSRFLPNVVTLSALNQLGVFDPELKANLDEAVNFAIQRLYSSQNVNGGWGWFPTSETSPIVTAYALIGLSAARENGYAIDQNVINRASEYLQGQINGFTPRDPRWRINRQAFLVYAMTRAGFFQPSEASVLYDLRTSMNIDAKAYLALAMHLMNAQDPRNAVFVSDFLADSILSATGAHFEDQEDPFNWTTDTRSTALVLSALIKLDPENQLIPNVVRWLMVARRGDAWETTQETAWAVMALTDWMVVTGELRPDYTFKVGLNSVEQDISDDTATPDNATESEVLRVQVADLLKDQANRLTFTRTDGQGNLYYTAHLKAYLPVPEVEPLSKGIIVTRSYYLADEPEDTRKPITEAKVGDNIEVVLTIIAPSDLYFVVVEDPIPAGSAAIDPGLTTSSVLADGPDLRRPLSRGWGWWYFSRTEFRDEKVVMYADNLPRGTYEYRYTLRLGLPGTFNVIPPTGQEFYFPEVYGRGAGVSFTILPGDEDTTEPVEAPSAEGESTAG